ncbi:MAG: C-terminal helicase domain-containing protein, partial [Gluconacetobacter diazotrophicus]|nr:C-terminal helicase domain-containing protein [Gluconacetobacter diazotrophicus]
FKSGEIKLLVCSDVAARGIDIGGLSHVFNFDVPIHAEDYVHRIGRTGRAGRTGHAYTIAAPEDRQFVEAIEKLTGHPIPPLPIEGFPALEWSTEDRPRRSRGRGSDRDRRDRPREDRGERVRDDRARDDRPRADRRDDERPRSDRPREDRPREDRPRDDRPRDDRSRDRSRDDRAPRFAEGRPYDPRSERRHRPDDLGPAVVGFGDEIPAFMLLPIPRFRPAADRRADEAVPEEIPAYDPPSGE